MNKKIYIVFLLCSGIRDDLLFASHNSGKKLSKAKRLSREEQDELENALLDMQIAKIAKQEPIVKKTVPKRKLTIKDFELYKQLDQAIYDKNLSKVKALLDLGLDINKQDLYGNTYLYQAVNFQAQDIVDELLKRGADVNLQNKQKWSPLMVAVLKNYADIVQLLLDHGALLDLQSDEGWTASMIAINRNNQDVLKMLLNRTVDLSQKNKDGWTALMIAADQGNEEAVSLLLQKYPSVAEKNDKRSLALIIAVQNNELNIVKLLLAAGTNINEQNHVGATALLYAIYNNDEAMIHLLLLHQADPNLQIHRGPTALLLALQNENFKVVDKLLAIGADPNLCDGSGVTPLMYAVQKGQLDVIETLLLAGADPNSRDLDNHAVYVYAMSLQATVISKIKSMLKSFGEYSEVEDLENIIRKDLVRIETKERQALDDLLVDFKKEVVEQEKKDVQKAEFLKRQKEQRNNFLRKKEAEIKRLQKLEEERVARKEQDKQQFLKNLRMLTDKIVLLNGYCSKEQAHQIQLGLNDIAIMITDSIKKKCSEVRTLFGTYNATISIDHIINVKTQFKKIPNQDLYQIIFTGGHCYQSIQNLIDYEFVTLKSKRILPNSCVKYTLINNFDKSEFIKTTFPESFSQEEIYDSILSSNVLEKSQEQDLMGNVIITVIAQNKGFKTKNILKTDFFSKKLVLLSSYPILE